MKFLLFIVPTLLASLFLFLAFGWLGLCAVNDCLDSGTPSVANVLIGAFTITLSFIPFAASSYIFLKKFQKMPLSKWGKRVAYAVPSIVGVFGLFQVVVDPGDAVCAGLPMLGFATCFALSIYYFPIPKPS